MKSKEGIGWLKVWLGILVVGMIGWGIYHIGKVSNLLLILDGVAIVIIVAIINFTAIKKIKSLKDL